MFYKGSLQEGISSAVGQQKLVFCFVTDGNEESEQWESEFLQDSSVKELIETRAVALRLQAGSDEAGYLAQIFPLPRVPTIVIMKHGELKEYFAPGTSREDFVRRVQHAFDVTRPPAPPAAAEAASNPLSEAEAIQRSRIETVLANRAARLRAEKAEADRKAKEEREKRRDKAKAEAEAGANTDAAKAHKQAELVKTKRQQQLEERKRIMQRIEADKAERREREARRVQHRIDSIKASEVAAALVNAPETKLPSMSKPGEMTFIQARLLDGSIVRSRFKTTSSLRQVRAWVDGHEGDQNAPYTFRHILGPSANRSIDETEEEKDLGELGLSPSSTLYLVSVDGFSSAYESDSPSVWSRMLQAIVGFFTWLMTLVSAGPPRTAPPPDPTPTPENSAVAAQEKEGGMRRRKAPKDEQRDYQLYNGNSLNFEPRPEDES
ncbi:hypothetical protein RJ55_06018 [Drechmeria coniospora]|nr:hypothetical protein RJ55_06018 [Drechmeria coniospora]